MKILDIIEKKRDKQELTTEEIEFFVNSYNNDAIPDYQAAALLMAIYLNKMTDRETADLTRAMANTGDKVDLSGVDGIKVDKHSSGGVGDKTTLVVSPMVAACGLSVAKMSGRGLGFGGGTIDKLEAIPNFRTEIPGDEFIRHVNEDKISVMGQSLNIAPADKKIYALRDSTGTVDDTSLIASSIMSKKLAGNTDAIVLDVKTGSGAFMKTLDDAKALAIEMVNIGNNNGIDTIAAITDMNQPLGYSVGNALEIEEVVQSLKGNGTKDFMEVCYIIGSLMLVKGGVAANKDDARAMLQKVIDDGSAYDKFLTFVANQGGDIEAVKDTSKLAKASYVMEVRAKESGYIASIFTEAVGHATVVVGAGRYEKTDVIDNAAGAIIKKKIGDKVEKGDVVAYLHSNDEEKGKEAVKMIEDAYHFTDEKPAINPMLYAIVDEDGVHHVA